MALFEQLFPPVVSFGRRTLSQGDRGTDVAVLQTVFDNMLKVMNPPLGPIGPAIPVTGVYDAATVQAVRNIQSYFGIPVTGVADAETFWLFGQGVGPHVTFGGPRYGSRTLTVGVSGGDVTVLQNRLNCFRYSSAIGHPANGVFGPETANAVRQFQQDSIANGDTGLAVDGVVGAQTGDATWIYTYAGGRGLLTTRVNNGFDVVFVQRVLAGLGFYRGPIHGFYDRATIQAVTNFQRHSGITVDGEVGPQTFFAIGRHNRVAAPGPMPVPPIGAAPGRQVNCCFVMNPTPQAMGRSNGAGVLIHNAPTQEAWVLVETILPEPSAYGSRFTGYGVRLDTEDDFTPMTRCPEVRSDFWTFALVAAIGPILSLHVDIAPLTAAGTPGPIILSGTGSCTAPTT